MTERLTRENLHGVWAAIATPFDEQDRFDEVVFRENLRRLHAAGVHGIYTTDADGEFYAIELDEFRRIADVFSDETLRLGVPSQMGVTWSSTKGIVDRLRIAAERGILGAHVAHPIYLPMTPASYRAFWDDVQAAVPDWFGLIHYNTPRAHTVQHGPDYAEMLKQIPNLIGTKHVGSDVTDFLTLMADAPELSHFTGEHALTPYMFLGARGVYSWFVNFNAPYLMAWYDAVVAERWDEARHRQARMHAFIRATDLLKGDGNLHAIMGKAVSAASSFLVPANRTRKPYLPVPEATVAEFRRLVEAQFPDLIWNGGVS